MKQTSCTLCGSTFVCDNGLWFTTCTCARDRPEELRLAHILDKAKKDVAPQIAKEREGEHIPQGLMEFRMR